MHLALVSPLWAKSTITPDLPSMAACSTSATSVLLKMGHPQTHGHRCWFRLPSDDPLASFSAQE